MSVFPTNILLATDGSQEASLAAMSAVELARDTNSELHVVTVAEKYPSYEVYRPLSSHSHHLARNLLDEQVKKIERAGGTVKEAHLKSGTAEREVIELAEEVGAELIVTGTRGRGGIRRALMGSVSTSVVHYAHCSVLVVRGSWGQEEQNHVPGKILLAYDGSTEASAAAGVAAEIANLTGSELHLLHVVPREPYPAPFAYIPDETAEAWRTREASLEREGEQARSFVEGQAQRMEARGARIAEAHLSLGRPDKEVVRLAEDLNAGLVVMGSRGRGGIGRALMGSVSDSVVRHAHCPVMVVRPRQERSAEH